MLKRNVLDMRSDGDEEGSSSRMYLEREPKRMKRSDENVEGLKRLIKHYKRALEKRRRDVARDPTAELAYVYGDAIERLEAYIGNLEMDLRAMLLQHDDSGAA
jgi:methyl coenzyme M reductase subunit C-like uncharacterized protein (methanogenesis marker protein 7)